MIWPVTYDASSLASHATAFAMSSAVPKRLSGIVSMYAFLTSSGRTSVIFDWMKPGATALQRTLREPSSFAVVFVSAMTPPFDAV